MAASAKQSASLSVDDLISSMQSSSVSTQAQQSVQESSDEFAKISANPFYELATQEDVDPNEQMKAIAKIVSAAKTKEERRAVEAAAVEILAYLQSVREEMAKDSIRLSDPKNFGVVRDTLDNMGGVMHELFEVHLKPLTDLIDVFERLGVADKAMDIYAEIENDRVAEEKRAFDRKVLTETYDQEKRRVEDLEREIVRLSNDKGFFGGIKKESKEALDRINLDIEAVRRKRDEAGEAVVSYDKALASNPDVADPSLVDAKRQLREFLATSSEGHEQAGKDLIEASIRAINESKSRTGTIKEHLLSMKEQIESQDDTATRLNFTYGLIQGGLEIAQTENLGELTNFEAKEGETAIDKLQRENKKTELNEYISTMDRIKTNVNATVMELASDTINIKNMRSSNQENIQVVEEMHTTGVATIASSLATTVNALGATALAESSNIATNIIETARARTDLIAKKQLVKTAGAANTRNDKMVKAVDSLKQFALIRDRAAEIQKAGAQKLNATNQEMERLARTVSESLTKSEGVTAEILAGATPEVVGADAKPAAKKNRPF